ncbi:ABC-type Fe3+-hydroxamate transport system, periplasmic component [Chelatococcus sambhunathii]|uniref:ABC-type Fe3+-hydroxamate transport system, periplasmic component n=1 Tax=Chelatococcus sambhunathii TaxID=363953 RepID=A0ABP2A2B2_9HYPH|nr:ABC transporter substrate-binding protein [Chelatococcus sambhunathii]CUA87566.1 ABC-type Fe3+-hydroxamate transport system, periplasmic component [Chelatococcus sambhunathii]
MQFLRKMAVAVTLAVSLVAPLAARAETVKVTDVLGREVEVKAPVERIILGEGRQIYFVATLDKDDPFKRIVGWRDDLPKADPDNYKAYLARYPDIAKLPTFGGMKEGSFDVEQAIALKPDVLFMNIESKVASDEAKLIEKLAAVGIPVVYVDFRERPFENTEPSMRLIGKLFGEEEKAEEFIAFRAAEIARITDRLKGAKVDQPLVMIERAGGYSDDCCMSFGRENFGKMVEIAGGRNLAADLIPGTFGVVNPEQIVAANPDVVIVTGGNWDAYVPGGAWVGLGPGTDLAEARRKLANLTQRPAFAHTAAVGNGRVHAIWHQFYNSPYQFVAIQAIARWLHPDLFKDVDADATLKTLHERFLPLPYKPGYWVSLEKVQ